MQSSHPPRDPAAFGPLGFGTEQRQLLSVWGRSTEEARHRDQRISAKLESQLRRTGSASFRNDRRAARTKPNVRQLACFILLQHNCTPVRLCGTPNTPPRGVRPSRQPKNGLARPQLAQNLGKPCGINFEPRLGFPGLSRLPQSGYDGGEPSLQSPSMRLARRAPKSTLPSRALRSLPICFRAAEARRRLPVSANLRA